MPDQLTSEQLKQVFQLPGFDDLSPQDQLNKINKHDARFVDMTPDQYLQLRNTLGVPLANQVKAPTMGETTSTLGAKAVEFLRPVLAPAAGLAVTGATDNPYFGVSAAALTDQALQFAQGSLRKPSFTGDLLKVNPDSFTDRALSTAEMLAVNEAGSRIVGAGIKGGKALLSNKLFDTPKAALEATYSQYAAPGKSSVAKLIEDLFTNKQANSLRSAQLARAGFTDLSQSITNIKPIADPNFAAERIKQTATDDFAAYQAASSKEAEFAKDIARNNAFQIQRQQNPVTLPVVNPTTGQPLTFQPPPVIETVEGPIKLDKSIKWAKKFLDTRKGIDPLTLPDNERQLLGSAQRIVGETHAQFDPKTGDLIKHDPVSFEQAWEWKKQADALSSYKKIASPDKVSSFFSDLGHQFNEDIERGIGDWPNGSALANSAWQRSKGLVAERKEIYQQPDKLRALLRTVKSPVSEVSNIIDDPVTLQKTLTRSQLQSAPGANLRGELQNYEIMRLMNNSWDEAAQKFNPKTLVDKWVDPAKQESYKLLYNSTDRARITEFVNAVAAVSDRPSELATGTKLYLGRYGLVLASGLLAGTLKGTAAAGAAGIASMGVALPIIGKLLTNKTTAPLLNAMMNGEPLNMSQKFAGRLIVGALQGTKATIKYNDGTEKEIVIGKDGETLPIQ